MQESGTSGFATRMAFAVRKDPAEARHRTHVTLQIVLVTLAWLVFVPLLLVYGLTGPGRGGDVFTLAAVLTLALPFIGAVIATRNQRMTLGGCYVVLTLLMILPALAIGHAG
jgi:hypothetical protein